MSGQHADPEAGGGVGGEEHVAGNGSTPLPVAEDAIQVSVPGGATTWVGALPMGVCVTRRFARSAPSPVSPPHVHPPPVLST